MAEDADPLCCCEYYNIRNQRTHLLAFCCECDELDKAVDDWIKGNRQTLEKLTAIVDAFSDRCRIPWIGGAQPFDCGIVFPLLILIFSAYLACLHFVLTIVVFVALPVVIICCYIFTIRVLRMRTRFFLSLSLTSTAGCFVVYFYHVAFFSSFYTNVFLVVSAGTMIFCFHLSRRKPNGCHFSLLKINIGSNNTKDRNNRDHNSVSLCSPTVCEDCCETVPPRAKYCRICQGCVLKYDHHCVWIDSCVGRHNHRIFLFTVLLYLVNIVVGCYQGLLFACEWSVGQVPDCSHAYNFDRSALVFVTCCYVILGGIALLVLLTQQIILISFNITSYEWRHMPEQQSCWTNLTSSPYSKGLLRNWIEFLQN